MKDKEKNIAFFILISFSFLFFEIIYPLLGFNYNNFSTRTKLLLLILKYIIFLAVLFIKYRKYLIDKWKDFRNNLDNYSGTAFKWWGLGFLLMMVVNQILNRIVGGVGANEETVQSLLDAEPIIAIIATTLFAPIVEELIYRKSLQDCFKNKKLFIIISGLIFGLIHVIGSPNPLDYLFIISYGLFGACFAKILVETDNVYSTIMVHMFHNGILSILAIVVKLL